MLSAHKAVGEGGGVGGGFDGGVLEVCKGAGSEQEEEEEEEEEAVVGAALLGMLCVVCMLPSREMLSCCCSASARQIPQYSSLQQQSEGWHVGVSGSVSKLTCPRTGHCCFHE
jgi:hypothetical protein